jgi:FMN-dependent NADH-azoreductase
MDVSIITAELTLASRVPAMAPLRDKARADLEAARRAATDLAVELGRRLLGDQ